LIVARGSAPALTTSAAYLPYEWIFPAGRSNIGITAVWGFAATIPADLWEACACEEARRLAAEAVYTPLMERKVGDEMERYKLDSAIATDWQAAYKTAIANYKRPTGRRLRNLRPRMI